MKTTNNKNQRKADSYKAEILKQTGMATAGGGQAYMRPEYHDRITEIIALFGENGMTVEDYLDNVLTAHSRSVRKRPMPCQAAETHTANATGTVTDGARNARSRDRYGK